MAGLQLNQLNELIDAVKNEDIFAVEVDGELKKVQASLLAPSIVELFAENGGAGLHNSIYRGKNLGSVFTNYQQAQIKAGTFNDLWIGDYWTINGINWRIAHFDYWYNVGDTPCTKHHVVVVPDTTLYNAQMHNTSSGAYEDGAANTTEGAYAGSDMYTKNLEQAKTILKNAFGKYVLTVRRHFQNAVTSGYPSAGTWYSSKVDLMTERMVYGNSVFGNHTALGGTTIPNLYNVDYVQLALFRLAKQFITVRSMWYWLQDVVSAASFAFVHGGGDAYYDYASVARGVRPAVAICGEEQEDAA